MATRENNPDDALYVKFYKKAVVDPDESKLKGYKVWKDVDYIFIKIDNFNEFDAPVRRPTEEGGYDDTIRFERQWEQYQKNNQSAQIIGIPLDKCAFITPARVKYYTQNEVFTAEMLAALSDSRCDQLGMGVKDDRNKANKYLDVSKQNEAFDSLKKQLDELKESNTLLQAELSKKVNKKEQRVNV